MPTTFLTDSTVKTEAKERALNRLRQCALAAEDQGWAGFAAAFSELASILEALPRDSSHPIVAALLEDVITTEEGSHARIDS